MIEDKGITDMEIERALHFVIKQAKSGLNDECYKGSFNHNIHLGYIDLIQSVVQEYIKNES